MAAALRTMVANIKVNFLIILILRLFLISNQEQGKVTAPIQIDSVQLTYRSPNRFTGHRTGVELALLDHQDTVSAIT